MKLLAAIRYDKLYLIGLVCITISLFFFCIPFFSRTTSDEFGLFIPNFAITVIYFVLLLGSKRLKRGENGLFPLFLFLILFLISAWSLNRSMAVFEKTVTWFAVLQVLLCINYIAFVFFESFPRWLQHVMTYLLGIALVTFAYLSCYLIPLFTPGVALFFFFGISLHALVPLLFVVYTVGLIKKITLKERNFWWSCIAGVATVTIVVTAFVIRWGMITNDINNTYRHSTVSEGNGLPGWVLVAQATEPDWITERALKTDLVYSTPSINDNFLWRIPSANFGEERKHDPLVMIAVFFAGKPNLSDENRINLLESMYDSRHQAQERLWSGEHLWTEHISTTVRIWPQFALSYTEKIITVSSAALRSTWNGGEEEAIYTFHLPEGALITSLSLWMVGKEAKGILTTKQKADGAYKTIVGRERRDPSVVHWQEGNTVSVRVFPVVAGESRKFKLGITAPLSRSKGKQVYENIWFDGPAIDGTTEDVTLEFQQPPKNFISPAVFISKGHQSFTRSGKYDPSWNIEMNDEPLSTDAFCFNGKQYTIHPYVKQRAAATINTVYLDINKSWSKDEFNRIIGLVKDKKIYVFHNELIQVTPENRDHLFDELHRYQFSLFPFFLIQSNSTSLLISKSESVSPNISDLEGYSFMQDMKAYLTQPKKIKLFNLGHDLSPYLKSFKEFRLFQYEHGTADDLKNLLDNHVFANDNENDNQVVIDNAEVAIVQDTCAMSSNAPDHLMRLFTYNHIMQKMGPCLLTNETETSELIQEAEKAYVVSPVSSLVVLETKQDYDRFNIKDSENSLKNASLKSKGAVPEPHEWALIIIAVLVVIALKFYPAKNRQPS